MRYFDNYSFVLSMKEKWREKCEKIGFCYLFQKKGRRTPLCNPSVLRRPYVPWIWICRTFLRHSARWRRFRRYTAPVRPLFPANHLSKSAPPFFNTVNVYAVPLPHMLKREVREMILCICQMAKLTIFSWRF